MFVFRKKRKTLNVMIVFVKKNKRTLHLSCCGHFVGFWRILGNPGESLRRRIGPTREELNQPGRSWAAGREHKAGGVLNLHNLGDYPGFSENYIKNTQLALTHVDNY